jgi:threonine dehydrogenase-like Zn-dependent dehydrogenase
VKGQRLVFTAREKTELQEFDIIRPSDDQILLQTLTSVVSPGTERAFLRGEPNTETQAAGYPFHPGYSNIGRVLEVGSDVSTVRPGQLVATMAGHQSHVLVRPPFRHHRARGMGSALEDGAPTELSWSLPEGLEPNRLSQYASFIIAAVGLYGASRAPIRLGTRVVIVGLGPIGLYAGQFARLRGALPLVGVGKSASAGQIARSVGFDETHPTLESLATSSTAENGACTVVIECTGRPSSVLAALRFCPIGSTLVLLGSTRGLVPELDVYGLVYRKAITIIGAHQPTRPSHNPLHNRWQMYWDADTSLRMMLAERIETASLVSHRFDITEYPTAYRLLLESRDALCIALQWAR